MAVKRISPEEAHTLMGDGYTYLDVRSVPEYNQGHPEGANNAPLLHMGAGGMAPNPEFVAVVQANFASDAKLVIGCKMGGRSQQAAMQLEAAGFTNLLEMRGGWSGQADAMGRMVDKGWSTLGLPAATAATPDGSWDELKAKK
ncbi:MAG: rhodanese-like domain-containing protein [Myxococcales bacterium]|nr:rhodanese-like domain-containing protein [Myxococcales bacterium]